MTETMGDRFDISPEVRRQVRRAARDLRRESTRSEALLWQALRNRKLGGVKFRRQRPIGPFVVDFFCPEERLVVEIDGPIHKGQSGADQERQQALEASGLRVIRVRAADVESDIDAVLDGILANLYPHLRPLSRAGERGDRRSG